MIKCDLTSGCRNRAGATPCSLVGQCAYPVKMISVQVVYRQGQIKTFIAPSEMPMATFGERIRVFGQPRLFRWMRDVKDLRAELAAGATLLETTP